MRTVTLVMLSVLVAAAPCLAAGGAVPADDAWRAVVEAGVRAIAAGSEGAPVSEVVLRLAVETAVQEIGARSPEEAAPIVFAAAVRAELRLRSGEGMPRVRAALRQEFRIAVRAGDAAAVQLRALERARRRLERGSPGAGRTPMPWWMGPGAPRGRWGT
jgi:hypothetical protein